MNAVYITRVTSKKILHGTLYTILASDGQRYSTKDPWAASLCLQAQKQGRAVELWSSAGWYDRNLSGVKLVDQPEVRV